MFKFLLNWESKNEVFICTKFKRKKCEIISDSLTKNKFSVQKVVDSKMDISDQLEEYCILGNIKKIKQLISKNGDQLYWDWGLFGACKGGHLDIVKLMISKGANDWNYGLRGACRGGHLDIVKLMISKGSEGLLNWNDGLYYACIGGHLDIVKIMISKGIEGLSDWNYGLYNACLGGHLGIIKLMISKGADEWSWGLEGACAGGHLKIVNLMILKGANNCGYCKKSMEDHLKHC
jgi:hypothetical protein